MKRSGVVAPRIPSHNTARSLMPLSRYLWYPVRAGGSEVGPAVRRRDKSLLSLGVEALFTDFLAVAIDQ